MPTIAEAGIPGYEFNGCAWQQQVPNSELLVLPGNSYHIAVTDPDRCARATLDFIKRHSGAA